MKPTLPRTPSAVPQTLHTRIEIAKAICTLAGPDQDELLRQRRAEIAAIRRDLDALARGVRKLSEELPALVMAELRAALKKYSPDQPRVPAGNPGGGQWTRDGGNGPANDSRVVSDVAPDNAWIPGAQYAQNTRRGGGGPILINGEWLDPTPAQAVRLTIARGAGPRCIGSSTKLRSILATGARFVCNRRRKNCRPSGPGAGGEGSS